MNRAQKADEIKAINQRLRDARSAFLVSFSGLTVGQSEDLRQTVREASSSYKVVKNRLALRAIPGTPLEPLSEEFHGPIGVATTAGDPVMLAKALAAFAKKNPALTLGKGVVEGEQILEAVDVEALAKLPGMQELRAQLLCLIQSPATQIARLLVTPATQLARVLKARREKLGGVGA
ncbi:MAG: 50S ribosomal protein L10 [Acidobacteriota bacterium]